MSTQTLASNDKLESLTASVRNLASRSLKDPPTRRTRLPLLVLLGSQLVLLVSILVIPSNILFFRTAQITVDELSEPLLRISFDKYFHDWDEWLGSFQKVAQDVGHRLTTAQFLTTSFDNFTDAMEPGGWFDTARQTMLSYGQALSAVSCITNANISGRGTNLYNVPNSTVASVVIHAGSDYGENFYDYMFQDYSTNASYVDYARFPNGTFADPLIITPLVNQTRNPAYMQMSDPDPLPNGQGKFRYNWFGSRFGPGYLYWSYTINYYFPLTSPRPTYVCQAGANPDRPLKVVMQSNKPSNNSQTFVLDLTANGTVIANSEAPIQFGGEFYTWHNAPNTSTTLLASYLTTHSAFTSPNVTAKFDNAILADGSHWYIRTRPLPVDTDITWALVIAIPRGDFFGRIDTVKRTTIILVIVITVVSVLGITLGIWVTVVVPLRRMARQMKQLCELNFAVLEKAELDHRSLVHEVSTVQQVFNLMAGAL
ncbi:uncharacterized protein EV422DRAFT_520610 [Fimicolochytrium jonesii]|uniref:uncharacterized protein n=1 Tax=Fimicolochytrium jonesii TaxID=1396493 RepID=UPI0022FE4930|nr:uncharacterized protein EV422DRAFT_520610 [Fimicolochytrium jonesii]KAI8824584.1 hypothetical protein EV422DRAFT_520610 [Fimicolochytrium jonesii]